MTERILTLTKEAGLTQAEAARAMGVSPATASRVFNGERRLALEAAVRLLSFLNRPEHLSRLGRQTPITFEELFGTKEAA